MIKLRAKSKDGISVTALCDVMFSFDAAQVSLDATGVAPTGRSRQGLCRDDTVTCHPCNAFIKVLLKHKPLGT